MNSVRRALVFAFVEKYALVALALASYVLLARLLTPEEIGIYSVTAALVGIAQVIREFGVGSFLIQERNITKAHADSALGFSLWAGIAMFAAFFGSASLIGSFYGDERLAYILRITSLNFLILPACSISLSLLRREMKFDRLLIVNLAAGFLGFVATVGLALAGLGPQCMAWGTVVCNLATAIGAWRAVSAALRPGRPSLKGWKKLFTFGGQSTLAGTITTIAMDINDLVIGKLLGFAPVAMLNRALGLMNLFHRDLMGAARSVAYPAFAAADRQGVALEPRFIFSVAAVTAFGWPFYGLLALFPLETLRLMAGPQWDAAAPLVRIFAAAGTISSVYVLIPTLILAAGRVDLASRVDILVHVMRVLLIVCAALAFKSLLAVALAFLGSIALSAPIYFRFKNKCVGNDWHRMRAGLARSASVTLATLAAPGLVSALAGMGRTAPISLVTFALTCLTAALVWVFTIHYLRHPMAEDAIYQRLTAHVPGLR